MTAKAKARKKTAPKPQKAPARKPAKPRKPKKPERIKTGANGRPSDFRPEYVDEAYDLCLAGFTDIKLAEHFSVSENTILNWKKSYPEFLGALRRGKALADGRVARGLYERAIGCRTTEQHLLKGGTDPDGVELYQIVTTEKEHPPETNAAKFWLKNRQPDNWKENVGITDANGGAFGIVINEFLKPREAKP